MISVGSAFSSFVAARRAAIVSDFIDTITAQAVFHRERPMSLIEPAIERFLDHLLGALQAGDPAQTIEETAASFGLRSPEGMPFADAIELAQTFRRVMLKQALSALGEGVPGTIEGINLIEDICHVMISQIVASYKDLLATAERAVIERDTHYQNLYQRIPTMLHSIDADGRIVNVNDRWLETMGYEREEVLGRRSIDFLTEESARYAREVVMPDYFRTGRTSAAPYQFIRKDGRTLHLVVSAITERDAKGEFFRSWAVLVDVSHYFEEAAKALQESEARYRGLVELSPDAVAVQQGGRLIYVNPAGARILGAGSSKDLIGQDLAELVDPSERGAFRSRYEDAERLGAPVPGGEATFLRRDGEPIVVEAAGAPITYEGAPALQIVFRDVTSRRQIEDTARRSAVQEELIRTQQDLLRALSTPLVPLGKGALLMPVVGSLDAARAEQMTSTLLAGVAEHRARFAILDVTGVGAMDSIVTEAIVRATRSVRLLGAEPILTGLTPASARVLVEMGADLGGVVTRSTVRDGIAYALAQGDRGAEVIRK